MALCVFWIGGNSRKCLVVVFVQPISGKPIAKTLVRNEYPSGRKRDRHRVERKHGNRCATRRHYHQDKNTHAIMDAKERRILIGIIRKLDISCLNLEEAEFVNEVLGKGDKKHEKEPYVSTFRNLNHEIGQLHPDHYQGKPNTQFPIH